VTACIEDQLPVVLVNRSIDSHQVTEVVNNDALGIRLAIEHLCELGHRKLAFLGGPQDTSPGRDRFLAFQELADSGMFATQPDWCVSCTAFTEAAGHAGMRTLLNGKPTFTAVVAANDLLALGCYDALAEVGIDCPSQLSVTGFNDMPFVNRLSPPLTSVHIQHDELGVRAASLLLAEIRDQKAPRQTERLDPRLVIRQSTAAL
jgi:LacI family transcriptional regulator